jgi:hypothetical protein
VPARRAKLENGGLGEDPPGNTMTYYRVLTTWMVSQGSEGTFPVTARRAKRENGGLGEDPPGSTMTYNQVLRTWMVKAVKELSQCQRAERSEKTGVWGRIPQETR